RLGGVLERFGALGEQGFELVLEAVGLGADRGAFVRLKILEPTQDRGQLTLASKDRDAHRAQRLGRGGTAGIVESPDAQGAQALQKRGGAHTASPWLGGPP